MPPICPNVLALGTCSTSNCSFNHSVTTCQPCKKIFGSAVGYSLHLNSPPHHATVSLASSTGWVFCPVCECHISGRKLWNQHVSSPKHARQCQFKGVPTDVAPEEVATIPGNRLCATCSRHIPERSYAQHTAGKRHLAKERFTAYTAVLEEAESDKHGVAVTGDFQYGVVEVAQAASGVRKQATISTQVPNANIRLVNAELASRKGLSFGSSPFTTSASGARLTARIPITVTVAVKQSYAGLEEDRLELLFEDIQLATRFLIVKPLRIVVGSKAQYQALQPVVPYKPKKRSARHPEKQVEPGVKPPALGLVPYIIKLPHSDVPPNLKQTLEMTSVADIKRQLRILMPVSLNEETYGRFWRYLIWIEEVRMSQDLEYYDITGAKLIAHHPYYYVDVPGLAEKRPSVLVGDSILVRRASAVEGHWFEGGVHVVHKEEVGLRFGRSFSASPGDSFTVRFKLNRYPLRRQHQALDTAFAPGRLLFPKHVEEVGLISRRLNLLFNNRLIERNERQRMAVECVVKAAPGSVPFIIFGPPGTGKTVTVVEAILQVLAKNPRAKILACAPSNSAADLLASRLTALGQTKLFRFYAPSRPKSTVPDDLIAFTYQDRGHFSVRSASYVVGFSVCITTCVSASVFFGIGVPRGHFSHIFIDEAGQATEPEAMIAVKTMADNKTNVILSGDPKQLGPIVRSALAREYGLETSYVERLMGMGVYDPVSGNGKTVVKLTQNFRSHPSILKFPNERFYGADLVSCGAPKEINAFVDSAILPPAGKKFPIMFIGMSGKDDREASSPSFFNIQEALMVKEKVEMLRGDRKLRLSDADIGIITPYHAQVLKIRKTLMNFAAGIKVGSVEEFQGQERKVIIISTVRSSREFVEYDLKHTLGFVASPRRFNVAVTRAKALLIIIGDPLVLSLDPLWRHFLNYVYLNGGWTGKGISWDPREPVDEAGGYDVAIREAAEEDMSEFTRKMEGMTLAGLNEEDVEDVDVNVDRPWNRDFE